MTYSVLKVPLNPNQPTYRHSKIFIFFWILSSILRKTRLFRVMFLGTALNSEQLSHILRSVTY